MIVPSIDIINGKAVQLRQGKELVLESERDPVELAQEFNRYGEVAVIDLDAAMGKGNNRDLIYRICRVADVRVGGGIRDVETGRQLLRAGAKSLIIGTQATPEFLSNFPAERLIVALDHVKGKVVDKGWTNDTGESLYERAARLESHCSGYLVTFVENEGGLGGLPEEAAKEMLGKLKGHVTLAGGIAKTEEVSKLSSWGADVQVGMALYKGLVDPVEAVVQSVNFAKMAHAETGHHGGQSAAAACKTDHGSSDSTEGKHKESGVAVADHDMPALVPTIVQDAYGQVLMLAYSSAESLRLALRSGVGAYYSRSRKEIWQKGLTSGNTQRLLSCRVDCDRDSLLFTVEQLNAACHRNTYSCFGQSTAVQRPSVHRLFNILRQRKEELPAGSYSVTLFTNRRKLLKKLMEEAYEVCSFDSSENLRWEIADLLYFCSVLAVDEGIDWAEIEAELGGRYK